MKNFAVAALLAGCLLSSGCYFKDRARDFADIFRVSVGAGIGVSAEARAMPFGFGIGYIESVKIGLENKGVWDNWDETEIGFPVTTGIGIADDSPLVYSSYYRWTKSFMWVPAIERESAYCIATCPVIESGKDSFGQPRTEDYFWVEAGAGLIASARVGVNVAELFDFIIGLSTIDILGDDEVEGERACYRPAPPRQPKVESGAQTPALPVGAGRPAPEKERESKSPPVKRLDGENY